nr:hypothetical protein [Acetatifactor sp.]
MKREKFCRLLRSCAYLLFSLMVSIMLNGGVAYGYDDLTKVSLTVTYEEIEDESIYLAPSPKAYEKNINSESDRNNEVTSGRKVNEGSFANGFEGIKPANEKLSDGLLYNLREKYSFLTGDMTSSLFRFHQLGQRLKIQALEETTAFLQAGKGISYWRTILLLALLTVPAFISVSIKKTS